MRRLFCWIANWFARRSPAYEQLEQQLFELERRVLLIDSAVPYPKGTLAHAESAVLQALARNVSADVQVLILPARKSEDLVVRQVAVQLVEGTGNV